MRGGSSKTRIETPHIDELELEDFSMRGGSSKTRIETGHKIEPGEDWAEV